MEDQQDVNPVESSTTENQAVETAVQPQQTETKVETTEPVKTGLEPVDETGVPWKNRFFEAKRKSEELAERLPSIVEEKLRSVLATQGASQREATIAELEQYAIEHPEYRPQVEERKAEITYKKLASQMESKIQEEKTRERYDRERQESLNYVMVNYPEAFAKDANGRVVGWNETSPLARQIALYMQEPELAKHPKGLILATKSAYADLAMSQQARTQAQAVQLKAEVKDLQKKTLIEGSGKQSGQTIPSHRQAIERLKKTGSMKDAQFAVAELIKARLGE